MQESQNTTLVSVNENLKSVLTDLANDPSPRNPWNNYTHEFDGTN